jgi:hypothetical protein
MGLIYIEYISRRPGVDVKTFHEIVTQGQEGWDGAYGEDELLLNLGRTWRLGPEPEYLGVWHTPAAGLERLDGWDHLFRTGAVHHLERPFHEAARIDVAGCYEPLIEPVHARGGTYYAEFFRPRADLTTVRDFYAARALQHPRLQLLLLAHRIGRLAPEPGGVAVWRLPDLAALAGIAAELDDPRQAVELVSAGVYADLGQEIL